MKNKFKDQRIQGSTNAWTVSGWYDKDTSQVKLTRIEGDVSRVWEDQDFRDALGRFLMGKEK